MALVGLAGVEAALDLLAAARAGLTTLSAAEYFTADGLALVRAVTGGPAPFADQYPGYVLTRVRRPDRSRPTNCSNCCRPARRSATRRWRPTPVDGRRLWAYRERHTEAISTAGVPVKLDVCVPLPELAALADELPATVAAVLPAAQTILFGHLNEGNLHVNILGAAPATDEEVTDAVLKLVAAHHGSISSEHGVGRAKTAWLGLSRSRRRARHHAPHQIRPRPGRHPQPRRPLPRPVTTPDRGAPRRRAAWLADPGWRRGGRGGAGGRGGG